MKLINAEFVTQPLGSTTKWCLFYWLGV